MTRASRWAPLRASVLLAGGFVVVRIGYRLIFDEWSWSAAGHAAQAAVGFAALIVACGLLSSVIDLRIALRALVNARVGRSLGTALAIAFASIPSLVDTARRIRRAQLMRGNRRRAAMIVPLLESAVERALQIAAALEIRGFGAPHPDHFDLKSDAYALELIDASVDFDGHRVLHNVNARVQGGDVVVVVGPTGSGKSTVLESAVGLTEHFAGAQVRGVRIWGLNRSDLAPRETANVVSYVPQKARTALLGATPRDELDFRLLVAGHRRPEREKRVTELISEYGLEGFADRDINSLSAGQAFRLACASALSCSPRLVLFDEPFAHLDPEGVTWFVTLVTELKNRGVAIVIAEHAPEPLDAIATQWWRLDDGHLTRHNSRPVFGPVIHRSRTLPLCGTEVALRSHDASLQWNGVTRSIPDIEWHLGEIVAVTGQVGAGKTRFLNALAHPLRQGSVWVHGHDVRSKRPQPQLLSLIPDDVAEMFCRSTVAEELEWADRLAGARPGLSELTFSSLLSRTSSTHTADWESIHPRDLSVGSQRALAMAIALSHEPAVVLIDEPTAGLDPEALGDMAEVLRCVAETGTVVVCATHQREWASRLCHREVSMVEGFARTVSEPQEVGSRD